MSTPLANIEERLSKLEAAAAAAREATREANESTKALRLAEKAVRDLLRSDVADLVQEVIEAKVASSMAELGEATEQAMRSAVAKVGREFDTLQAIFMGHADAPDEPCLHELARRRKEETTVATALERLSRVNRKNRAKKSRVDALTTMRNDRKSS